MKTVKFLLDEHVAFSLRDGLRRREPEIIVRRIGEPRAPGFGTLDPEIFIWCEENQFSLVTNDHASMPVHFRDHLSAGRHLPGLFILSERLSIGETIEELLLIWEEASFDEFTDRVNYLPISA